MRDLLKEVYFLFCSLLAALFLAIFLNSGSEFYAAAALFYFIQAVRPPVSK